MRVNVRLLLCKVSDRSNEWRNNVFPSLRSAACETMFCLGCGVDLKERKGDRRLLCSSSTRKVLPALLETVKGAVGKDVKLDEEKINGSYICKPCFREMEKLQKLEEQLRTVREHLNMNVRKAIPYLPVVLESSESTSQIEYGGAQAECSGRKRQLSSQRDASTSPKRRRKLMMNRGAVARSNSRSPAVSVS